MPDEITSARSDGPTVDVLSMLRRDWQRHLRNLNRAANTQRIYDTVAQQFCAWLTEHQRPTDPRQIGKREIEDFMGHDFHSVGRYRQRCLPGTSAVV